MKNRNQFLDSVSRSDRLNVAIDVWITVLCGMPDSTSLLHPSLPLLQTLSVVFHKVRSTTETLRSCVLPLSWTRHCIAGFWVTSRMDLTNVFPRVATFFICQ